jgi:hypothetical protein
MNKWEQFSHTTRTFLMDPVDDSFIKWTEDLVTLYENKLCDWMIVTDQNIIKDIYDLTEIPDETNDGVKANDRIGKKNSQVMAPFLLILIPDEENPESNFVAGWLQSQVGFAAIEKGYHTGFCICVDHKKLSPVLKENNLWNPAVIEVLEQRVRPPIGCTTVLFSVGTADPDCEYNYSKIEQRMIKSTGKMLPSPNITIND